MDKNEMAAVLRETGVFLDLLGENQFKVLAYLNASRTLENLSEDLDELIKQERLGEIKGFGAAIQEKILELKKTGKLRYHEELKRTIPAGLLDLLRIPGLGPKKIRAMWTELQIENVETLKQKCTSGHVAKLRGFGDKTQAKILEGIAGLDKYRGQFLWVEGWAAAQPVLAWLAGCKAATQFEVSGSMRRKKEIIRDVDIVCATSKPEEVMDHFVAAPGVAQVMNRGETKSSVLLEGGLQCDLRCVSREEYPFAVLYFTGSKEHNVVLRQRAIDRKLKLNEYGLYPVEGKEPKSLKCADEAAIYAELGLPYVEPELREDTGEIQAAEAGKLPQLVDWDDIRGTFHCHTQWSDGANTLEEMAKAARDLGWEYLGIADHSRAAAIANGLSEQRLREQIKAIDQLNEKFEGKFRLFKGSEVDVLASGELDFPDEVLAQLDFVVASVHSSLGGDSAKNTARVLKAISNPFVTMIGHLSGRLLLSRDGMKLDLTPIFEAAGETGTILELNGSANRLELDWRCWKSATAKGVGSCINPDAHETRELNNVRLGIGIARKGWLTPARILNTRRASEVARILKLPKKKRAELFAAKTSPASGKARVS